MKLVPTSVVHGIWDRFLHLPSTRGLMNTHTSPNNSNSLFLTHTHLVHLKMTLEMKRLFNSIWLLQIIWPSFSLGQHHIGLHNMSSFACHPLVTPSNGDWHDHHYATLLISAVAQLPQTHRHVMCHTAVSHVFLPLWHFIWPNTHFNYKTHPDWK